jgi:carboxypeptidase PM20D1
MRTASRALAKIGPGTPIIPYMTPYATDGSILRRAVIPIYGTIGLLFKAADDFSQGLNERVPVRSFFDGLEYWHTVIDRSGHALSDF